MAKGNGSSIRAPLSWIDSYVKHTDDTPAPRVFRLWSAIGTVGAALERRVHVRVANQITYPNLFVLLVGRPGVGKSNAINPASGLLTKAGGFHLAPRDTTKASLLKWMASDEARDRISTHDSSNPFEESHSVALHVSELGVFVRAHELDLLSMLCELYDCPDEYQHNRIYQGKDNVSIPRPQISILAGTQPGYLASVFPPEAWVQGFMARVILIHSGEAAKPSLFDSPTQDKLLENKLIRDLAALKDLQGEFKFTQEAKDAIGKWYETGMNPAPNYPRLETYTQRRIVHLLKLCMIASASRDAFPAIDIEDFILAQDWMLKAEEHMPDVFLEMAGRSDSDNLLQLHHYAWTQWSRTKKAIHKTQLMSFLSSRCPAWAADKILTLAVDAGYFTKVMVKNDPMYTPQPRNNWGVM